MAQGLLRLLDDFGTAEPVPGPVEPPPDWLAEVRGRTAQLRELVTRAQVDRCPFASNLSTYRASMAKIMDQDIGPIKDVADQIDGLLPKVPEPGPPPPPPPTGLTAVIGTYSGHGLAKDAYAGRTDEQVNWGPHHGWPIVAPADGRVEVYSFGTPLSVYRRNVRTVEDLDAYEANWHALADGWVCWARPFQAMYVAVWYPSAPYSIEGQRIGHFHYGHVHQTIKAGPVTKDEQFAMVWDSGIRFEPGVPTARAAHTHCCAGAGTQLSPNGDLDGTLAAKAQGWRVTDVGFVPGPSEYQSGRYCAGRLLSDFQQNGKPIPPMPGG